METKSAVYTTEFWITVLTVVGLTISAIIDALPDKYASIAVAVSAGAYALARGLAKSGNPADSTLAANYRIVPRRSDGLRR